MFGLPVTVFSQVVAKFDVSTTKGCIPLSVTFKNTSTEDGLPISQSKYIFKWDLGEGQFSDNIPDNAKAAYVIAGKKSITVTIYKLDGVTVVASYTIPTEKQIEVFPNPVVVSATPSKSPTCKDDPITLTPKVTSSSPITSWIWDFGDGSSFGNSEIASHSYSSQGTYMATVFVTDENGCSSTKAFSPPAKIVINSDRPVADFTIDKTQTCEESLNVVLTNKSSFPLGGKITGYQWDFSDGTIDKKESTTKTFTRTSNQDVKFVYLTAFGDNGCNSESKSAMVTLYKLDPQITITDNVKTLSGKVDEAACGGSVTVSTAQENGTIYKWSLNGSTSNSNSIIQTLSSGNQTVYLTATNPACSVPVEKKFTVEPIPDFSITPLGSFHCAKEWTSPITPILANVTIDNIDWYVSGELLPFSTTSGTESSIPYTFDSNNSYDISANVTTVNGCKGSKSFPKNIQVYFPEISIDRDKYKGCVPLKIKFENKSTYNVPNNADFISKVKWNFGDNKPNSIVEKTENKDTITYTYVEDGDFVATLFIETNSGSDECKLNTTRKIYAGKPPVIKYDTLETTVCAAFSTEGTSKSGVTLTYKTYVEDSDGSENTSKYDSTYTQIIGVSNPSWSSDPYDGPNSYNKVRNFRFDNNSLNEPGVYKLKMIEYYNNCPTEYPDERLFTIKGPIIKHTPVDIDCESTYKINIKAEKLSNALHWDWIISKDTVNALNKQVTTQLEKVISQIKDTVIDFKHYGKGTGHYNSLLIAYNETNNCIDSSRASFIITNTVADVSLNDTTPCVASTQYLTTGTMKDPEFIEDFEWSIQNPAGVIDDTQDNHPNVTHRHKGTNFNWFNDYVYTDPANNNAIKKEYLYFEDRGVYTINMMVQDVNSCKSTKTIKVRAYKPTAGFKMSDITSCLPVTLTFTDTTKSFSTIVSREWSTNGDSLVSKIGNDTTAADLYSQIKTYQTSLKVTDSIGCTDFISNDKGVSPLVPTAKIISETKVCIGTAAEFSIDKTQGLPYVNNVDYFIWDFGDGSPTVKTKEFTISHVYDKEITNPNVIVSSYLTTPSKEVCENKDTSTVLDIKDAKAQFDFIYAEINCIAAKLTAKPVISDRFKTIKWTEFYNNVEVNKGDDLKLPQAAITFQLPGDHYLTFTVTSDYRGCEVDQATRKFTIEDSKFDVFVDKDTVCVNDTMTFSLQNVVNINNSVHYWSFGDGTVDSTKFEVKHAYESVNENGLIPVKFIVETPHGCTNFKTVNIYLRQVGANFDRGANDTLIKGCVPFNIPFTNKSVGTNMSYLWNFGDNTLEETAKDPVHTFTKPGDTVTVTLQIQGNDNGTVCKDDQKKTIITYAKPHFGNNIDSIPLCEGKDFTITLFPNTNTVIDSIKADKSIESISADKLSIKVNPLTTTSYTVYNHYFNSDNAHCSSDSNVVVKVQNRPAYHGAPYNYLVYVPYDTLKTKAKDMLYPYVNYSMNNDSLQGITYKWEPSYGLNCTNCANPTVNVDKDVEYTITMSDPYCFTVVEKIAFKLIPQTEVGLPSAFTPNIDGNNDFVIPRGWGIKEFLEIEIFNRWGQLVYKSNDLTKGWDGTFNGRPQDPDTYAWLIKYKDTKDVVNEKKGYITLLR